jgi:hypothetical protein
MISVIVNFSPLFLVAQLYFTILVKIGTRFFPIFSSLEYNYYRGEPKRKPKKEPKKKKEKEKKDIYALRFDVYNFRVTLSVTIGLDISQR